MMTSKSIQRGNATRGTLMILFILGVIALAGGVFLYSSARQKKQDQAKQNLQETTERVSQQRNEEGRSGLNVEEAQEVSDATREAAETQAGVEAAVMRFVADMQTKSAELRDASSARTSEFMQVGGFQPGTFNNREDLRNRIALSEEMLEISEEHTEFFKQIPDDFRAKLKEAGATETQIEMGLDSLTSQLRYDIVMQEREIDEQIFLMISDLLKLYEEFWGEWQWNAGSGGTVFDESVPMETVQEFERLTRSIQQSAMQQAQLQMQRRQAMRTEQQQTQPQPNS